MTKFIVITITLVTIIISYLLLRPVIYRQELPGDPTGEPDFVLLNPLRDKSPEKAAEYFLQKLKEEKCHEVFAELPNQQSITSICEKEKLYPLTSWQLANRTGDARKTRLYYEVKRNNYPILFGQLWINVEKLGEQWRVTNYECW